MAEVAVQECFLQVSASGAEAVAWTAELAEADLALMRQHIVGATGPGLVHYRFAPLDDERLCLSQMVGPFTSTQTSSVHALVMGRSPDLDPFAFCQAAETFLPICPYSGATVPARRLSVPDVELETCFDPLADVVSLTHLAVLIHRAALATATEPLHFAPLHPAQTLPWFSALYHALPPDWRADVFFATWLPSNRQRESWVATVGNEPSAEREAAWDPLVGPSGGTAVSPFARAMAEAILGAEFGEVRKLAERIKGSRSAEALQEIAEEARQRPMFRRQERHDALLALARDRAAAAEMAAPSS